MQITANHTFKDIERELNLISHVFEDAGLGRAPFKVRGYHLANNHKTGCAHCGIGIKHVFTISSVDGDISKVSANCIIKSKDTRLLKEAKKAKNLIATIELKKKNQARSKAMDAILNIIFEV